MIPAVAGEQLPDGLDLGRLRSTLRHFALPPGSRGPAAPSVGGVGIAEQVPQGPRGSAPGEPNLEGTRPQRWLARLSFVLAGAAIVILGAFAGQKGLTMLAVGLAAAVVSLAAAFFFLSRRGIWRWLSLAVFVLAPIAVIVVYAFRDLL